MLRALLAAILVTLGAAPGASASHLATPESVLEHRGSVYVSLIGAFGENDGAIVRIDTRGLPRFTVARGSDATPLVDPKGLTVVASAIWVTDVDVLRSYDLDTGAAGRMVDLSASARFLNDLTVDRRGNLWATDSQANALYRITKAGKVRRIPLPAKFAAPNGVAVHPKTGELWIVTAPGVAGQAEIVRRTAKGKLLLVKTSRQFRGLDGIVFVGTTAYISDFQTGRIWKLTAKGKLTRRARLGGSPADLTYSPTQKRLLIPLLQAGHFTTLKP